MTALPEVLEKLERCPFCGREPRLVDLAGFEVLCDCGASMVTGPTRVEAITAWNTRPALLRDAGDGWRSIDEIPPHNRKDGSLGTEYLVYPSFTERTAFFGRRLGGKAGWYKYGSPVSGITHWRPLPQPPAMHAPGGATGRNETL